MAERAQRPDAEQWVATHESHEHAQAAANPMTLEEATWVNPKRFSGDPCFRPYRLPIHHLFDWLAAGIPLQEYLDTFEVDRCAAAGVILAASEKLSDHLKNLPPDTSHGA